MDPHRRYLVFLGLLSACVFAGCAPDSIWALEYVDYEEEDGGTACGSTNSPGCLETRSISGQSFKFSYIPAGTFTMGSPTSDTESSDGERPQHQVTISKPFLMLRTEVTQAQWVAIWGNNPSYFTGDMSRPVEQVSWYDVVDFCNQLSTRDGFTAAYTINGTTVTLNAGATGYRLPTEAEWEYAARSGTTTPRYGTRDQIAWYNGNSGNTTHPVGQKTPNAWNLYDMLGNVWEWNWDWYGGYSAGSQTDPQGPASGSYRVYRGGGCSGGASRVRAGDRDYFTPAYRYFNLGFRPLRSLP
jgi:formylglycine-generating enzyme required for sulfatase activity